MGKNSLWDRPLMIAAIGSVIAFMGQLFGTVLPIYLGPDISDYDLYCDPVYVVFTPAHMPDLSQLSDLLNTSQVPAVDRPLLNRSVVISANNLHPLQRYKHKIYLDCIIPKGAYAKFSDDVITADQKTTLTLDISMGLLLKILQSNDKYPVIIEGTGSDGKVRNCTLYITSQYVNFNYNPALIQRLMVQIQLNKSMNKSNLSGYSGTIAYKQYH